MLWYLVASFTLGMFHFWIFSKYGIKQNVVELNTEFQKRRLPYYGLEHFVQIYSIIQFLSLFEIHAFIEESWC